MRLGPLAGLLGTALFTSGWIVGGLLQTPAYRWSSQEISDLGALTARHAWVWNLADSVSGGLIAVFAVSLFGAIGANQAGRIGALLIGVIGVGGVLDGLLREDCPLSTSVRCQRLRQHPGLSWHHQAHDIESAIVAAAALLAPFVMARAFRQLGSPEALRYCTIASGALLVALGGLYALLYGEAGGGIVQRLLTTTCMTWLAVLAVWVLKKPSSDGRRSSAPDGRDVPSGALASTLLTSEADHTT
jgi:hypothetical protein